MRWERLFADLEAQADAEEAAELAGRIVEHTRVAVGELRLVDRLRAAENRPLRLTCAGVGAITGVLEGIGPDWVLLSERPGRQALVALTAVTSISGLGRYSAAPGSEGRLAAKLTLRYGLRGLARDRAQVGVAMIDGGIVVGTIDRIGADFIEIAEHPAGEPRRAGTVRQTRTVPISALSVVRSN